MSTTRTAHSFLARRLALVLAVSGFGLTGLVAAPAGALPPGPGDLCGDVVNGCPALPDPIDDFTAGDPVDEPEDVPEDNPEDTPDGGGASVDRSDTLPTAPVGDVIVANPTFTG